MTDSLAQTVRDDYWNEWDAAKLHEYIAELVGQLAQAERERDDYRAMWQQDVARMGAEVNERQMKAERDTSRQPRET